MFETLTATMDDGGIGSLTLNQPDRLNPLGTVTLQEIAAAASWFDEQEARVVVVSGAGRAFSAGADLATFAPRSSAQVGSSPPVDTWRAAEVGWEMAAALESMEALAIASIHGWCVGGGLVLAAACDLRVAGRSTMFSIPEVDLGIPLAWGGVPRLVREIGPALAKELIITCRPFDAGEAHRSGFLNRVVDDDQLDAEVHQLASAVAAKARFTVSSTKRHVNAVTEQMVGTARSWSDAGGLVQAFRDPECAEARSDYLARRAGG